MRWLRSGSIGRMVLLYGLSFLLPLLLFNLWLVHRSLRPSACPLADSLPIKTRYYARNAANFDLVFLGDSRTYCNIQPHLLDPLLDTHGANLGMWGHYFATQYGQLQDIVAHIPKETTVVWSIGHRNFEPVNQYLWWDVFPPAQKDPFPEDGAWWLDKYPIGIENAPLYLWWGYPWHSVKRNCTRFGPLGEVFETASAYFFTFTRRRNNPVFVLEGFPAAAAGVLESHPDAAVVSDTTQLKRRLESASFSARVLPLGEGDSPTSLVVYTTQGSYCRYELEPAYFRKGQQQLAEKMRAGRKAVIGLEQYAPSPPLWRNFLAMLDCFEQHGVHLVVNEMEEAPFLYEAWGGREVLRRFMREQVRTEVERRDIPYVRVDFDQLQDADYFDWDHLNANGLSRFTPMLADVLRPYLQDGSVEDAF